MGLMVPSPCRLTAASPPPSSKPMILSYLFDEVGEGVHGVAGTLRLPLDGSVPPPSSPPMILSYLSDEVGEGVHGVAGALRLPLDGSVPPALVPTHDLVIPVQ
jgi:hypothetical protein